MNLHETLDVSDVREFLGMSVLFQKTPQFALAKSRAVPILTTHKDSVRVPPGTKLESTTSALLEFDFSRVLILDVAATASKKNDSLVVFLEQQGVTLLLEPTSTSWAGHWQEEWDAQQQLALADQADAISQLGERWGRHWRRRFGDLQNSTAPMARLRALARPAWRRGLLGWFFGHELEPKKRATS